MPATPSTETRYRDVGGVVEQLLDHPELPVAAREVRLEAVDLPDALEARTRGMPATDRPALPCLSARTSGGLVGDRLIRRPHRRLTDEDGPGRRDRLDPGGGVHEMAATIP